MGIQPKVCKRHHAAAGSGALIRATADPHLRWVQPSDTTVKTLSAATASVVLHVPMLHYRRTLLSSPYRLCLFGPTGRACRMVRIRTASSERGRWAAAGLLGLGLLAALLLWRASHGLSGSAFGALSAVSQVGGSCSPAVQPGIR